MADRLTESGSQSGLDFDSDPDRDFDLERTPTGCARGLNAGGRGSRFGIAGFRMGIALILHP